MNLFDDLNEKNYLHFAMKYYDNRQCTSVEELEPTKKEEEDGGQTNS